MGNMDNALSSISGKVESVKTAVNPLPIGSQIKAADTGHSHTVDEGSIVKGSKVKGSKGGGHYSSANNSCALPLWFRIRSFANRRRA